LDQKLSDVSVVAAWCHKKSWSSDEPFHPEILALTRERQFTAFPAHTGRVARRTYT
jgi:hypothetical protein